MFSDVPASKWYYKPIMSLVAAGLMKGYPDGTFRPDEYIKRGEYAAGLEALRFRLCLIAHLLPKILPAVFTLVRDDGGYGTGFYISPDGHAVTAKHVLEGAKIFTAVNSGDVNKSLSVISISSDLDAAILKTAETPPAWLKFAAYRDAEQGQHVGVIGSPSGREDSYTQGVISFEDRQTNPIIEIQDVFQTDAAINGGNSGGPVIDGNGDVIGVVNWKLSGKDNMGFCSQGGLLQDFIKKAGIKI